MPPLGYANDAGALVDASRLRRLRHLTPESFKSKAVMEDLAGRIVGPYELGARIGTGGMATVYRAVHRALGQERAVKVLLPAHAADPTLVQRFRSEGKLAAGLRHPNIVHIYDVGEEGPLLYLVMDLVEGISLGRLLEQEKALPLERAIPMLQQLASALDYAHDRGIFHRDVKAGNVLVGPDGRVTLFDFGIARGKDLLRLTRPGLMVGTPHYLAPEVISGQEGDARADLYALGILAYEMLTGNLPFGGTDTMAVLYAQVNAAPPPLQGTQPHLTEAIERIVLRQLSKKPGDRYPTAGSFVGALNVAASQAQGSAQTTPAPGALAVEDEPATVMLMPPASRPSIPVPQPATPAPSAQAPEPVTMAPPIEPSLWRTTASSPTVYSPGGPPTDIAPPVSPASARPDEPATPPSLARPPMRDAPGNARQGAQAQRDPLRDNLPTPQPIRRASLARITDLPPDGDAPTFRPVLAPRLLIAEQTRAAQARRGNRVTPFVVGAFVVALIVIGVVVLRYLDTDDAPPPAGVARAATATTVVASVAAQPTAAVPVVAAVPPTVASAPAAPAAKPAEPTAASVPAAPPTAVPTVVQAPPSPEQQLQAAQAAIAGGEFATTLPALAALQAAAPGTEGLDEAIYRAHIGYGQQLLDQGALDQSYAEFGEALKARPDDAAALDGQKQVVLAKLWTDMEAAWDKDEAIVTAALEEILVLDPTYRDANVKLYALLVARADRLVAEGDNAGAIAALRRAAEIYPAGPEARARLDTLTAQQQPAQQAAPAAQPARQPAPAAQPAQPAPQPSQGSSFNPSQIQNQSPVQPPANLPAPPAGLPGAPAGLPGIPGR